MELRLGWPTWNNSPDKYGISFRSLGETVAFEAFGMHSRLLVMVLSLLPEVADSHTVEQDGLVGGIRVSIMGWGGCCTTVIVQEGPRMMERRRGPSS